MGYASDEERLHEVLLEFAERENRNDDASQTFALARVAFTGEDQGFLLKASSPFIFTYAL